MSNQKKAEGTTMLDQNEISGMSSIEFFNEKYDNFWIRYCFRESGNLVYQFYCEDPERIDAELLKEGSRLHTDFRPDFKDVLIAVFKKHIPIEGKLDISYVGYVNSFCVIALGYAQSLSRDSVLKPIFEDLDKELNGAATPA